MDRYLNVAKYRWEFMRRNEDYRRRHRQLQEKYLTTKDKQRGKKEISRFTMKWFGDCYSLINPDMDFDDVCEWYRDAGGDFWQDIIKERFFLKPERSVMGSEFAAYMDGITGPYILGENPKDKMQYQIVAGKNPGENVLVPLPQVVRSHEININVDLEYCDDAIITQIKEIVARERNKIKITKYKKRSKPQFSKYDKYLQVWDLKRKGLKHDEIVEKVFREKIKEEKIDFDSARTEVSRYYKKAKKLIGGGFKELR